MKHVKIFCFTLLLIGTNNAFATRLHDAIKEKNLDRIQFLIQEEKFDINAKNKNGDTPLHLACVSPDTEIIQFLLNNGAKINEQNFNGKRPLNELCTYIYHDIEKRITIIDLLMERGANINAMPHPVLHSACQSLKKPNKNIIKYLLQKKARINQKDIEGNTPLHHIASYGTISIVQFLIRHGAKVKIKNKIKETILHKAALNSNKKMYFYLKNINNLRKYKRLKKLKVGLNSHTKNEFGITPKEYFEKYHKKIDSSIAINHK